MFRGPLVRALALATLAAACGENAWRSLPTGPDGSRDVAAPSAEILSPTTDQTFAVGTPLQVQVHATDEAAIASVEFTVFALRGDPELGEQVRVERFEPKTVQFPSYEEAVLDTVVTRNLVATGDTVRENSVYVVATVTDFAGQVRADTTLIALGGPDVKIVAPFPNREVSAGNELPIQVTAVDRRDGLRQVGVELRHERGGDVVFTDTLVVEGSVDSTSATFSYGVPAGHRGDIFLQAFALSGTNVRSASAEVAVRAVAPAADQTAPTVSFQIGGPTRVARHDTVTVTVSATDNTMMDSVGVFVRASQVRGTTLTALNNLQPYQAMRGSSGQFRIAVSDLITTTDTASLQLEVTAVGVDTAGNCGYSNVPGQAASNPCPSGSRTFTAGARWDLFLTRGTTVAVQAGMRIADLVADSVNHRVYLSNFAQNRVEVLPFDGTQFGMPISVGSEPWGLTIGRAPRDTLYVANSGGTNISVVSLSAMREVRRIQTPNIRLYDITFDMKTDSAGSYTPVDYSDRPQFIGQVVGGQLLYSTKPTPTRSDGTIRIYDPNKDVTREYNRATEIFVDYAAIAEGKAIAVNALSASVTANVLTVCPRRLLASQADPECVSGRVGEVAADLGALRDAGLSDTRLLVNYDIESVGLTDTTFVAVSRDNSTVAFGEGAVAPGRIFHFRHANGQLFGSSVATEDLVGNAAERVISLGLNGDGSLGVARGAQAYFFDDQLRLQGVVTTGAPTGGSAMHPLNDDYPNGGLRWGFISGEDEQNGPYVDIIDTYTFRSQRRVYVRDRITGGVVAVPVGPTDPRSGELVLRVFALTERGVLQLGLRSEDLP